MQHTKEKGLILQDEALIKVDKMCYDIYTTNNKTSPKWQVKSVAHRYRLPLHRAKLICTLSGVGGLV